MPAAGRSSGGRPRDGEEPAGEPCGLSVLTPAKVAAGTSPGHTAQLSRELHWALPSRPAWPLWAPWCPLPDPSLRRGRPGPRHLPPSKGAALPRRPARCSCPHRPSYPPLALPPPRRNVSLTSFLESEARPVGQGLLPLGPRSPGRGLPSGAPGSWVQKVLFFYRALTCKNVETCPTHSFWSETPGHPPPHGAVGAKTTQNHTRAEAPPRLLLPLDGAAVHAT